MVTMVTSGSTAAKSRNRYKLKYSVSTIFVKINLKISSFLSRHLVDHDFATGGEIPSSRKGRATLERSKSCRSRSRSEYRTHPPCQHFQPCLLTSSTFILSLCSSDVAWRVLERVTQTLYLCCDEVFGKGPWWSHSFKTLGTFGEFVLLGYCGLYRLSSSPGHFDTSLFISCTW